MTASKKKIKPTGHFGTVFFLFVMRLSPLQVKQHSTSLFRYEKREPISSNTTLRFDRIRIISGQINQHDHVKSKGLLINPEAMHIFLGAMGHL